MEKSKGWIGAKKTQDTGRSFIKDELSRDYIHRRANGRSIDEFWCPRCEANEGEEEKNASDGRVLPTTVVGRSGQITATLKKQNGCSETSLTFSLCATPAQEVAADTAEEVTAGEAASWVAAGGKV
jgi:hypothetical protein